MPFETAFQSGSFQPTPSESSFKCGCPAGTGAPAGCPVRRDDANELHRAAVLRPAGVFRRLDGAVEALKRLEHVTNVIAKGENQLEIEFAGSDDEQAALLAALINAGHRVLDFRERQVDLEDVFLRITTGAVN